MNLVDANVLLYAVNTDAPHHEASRRWLDDSLSGAATVGFAWLPLLAFLRLVTKSELFPSPLTPAQAFDRVDAWLSSPAAVIVEPTARHASLVRGFLEEVGSGGNLVNDAHLAALSVEHGGRVVSFDRNFARFSGVELLTPGD